ncbi:MAG: DUF4832 domain-containing protein [Lachnospiraceae bacterium]|nr:DUF4832 domain-containing protein [Lachnospiraceae bacterium]
MKKRWLIPIILFAVFMVVLFIYTVPLPIQLMFEESKEQINNPRRGVYFQIPAEEVDHIKEYYGDDKFSVVLIALNLKDYLNQEKLPKEKIKELKNALKVAREEELSVVLRCAYDWGGNYEDPESDETIKAHIRQLAPVINGYKECILVVQAGFIGPYGEWHSSKFIEGTDDGAETESASNGQNNSWDWMPILKEMDEQLDDSISIALRRPMFVRRAIAEGIPKERLTVHDDALFSTDTDMGTFVEENYTRKTELTWMHDNMVYGATGGETTNVSEYTTAKSAVQAMKQMHLTYLNYYYNTEVWKAWGNETYKGQRADEYIKNHLGYRAYLRKVKLQGKVIPGRAMEIGGTLKNTGFAGMPKEYSIKLAIKDEEGTRLCDLKTDFSDAQITFSGKVDFPGLLDTTENSRLEIGIKIGEGIQLATKGCRFANHINYFAAYEWNVKKGKWQLVE